MRIENNKVSLYKVFTHLHNNIQNSCKSQHNQKKKFKKIPVCGRKLISSMNQTLSVTNSVRYQLSSFNLREEVLYLSVANSFLVSVFICRMSFPRKTVLPSCLGHFSSTRWWMIFNITCISTG